MDDIKSIMKNPKIYAAAGVGFASPFIFQALFGSVMRYVNTKKQQSKIYVGIQLGGTNFRIGIGQPKYDNNGVLIDFELIKQETGRVTNKPDETINKIVETIVNNLGQSKKIDFVGISSFGPLELHRDNQNYGSITSTPKQGWRNTNVLGLFKQKLEGYKCQQYAIETDVNSAALAQFKLGNHQIKESLVYVTVGTGVGAGVICQKTTVHGLTHPEGGHIIVKRHPKQYENFDGVCPFHKNCLQGMVANHSISSRTKVDFTKLHEIEDNEKIWQIVGYYLAQLCLNLTLILSPQKIVIGGGILNRKILYKYIHEHFLEMLAQYVEHPLFTPGKIQQYIVAPALGADVGVKGALLLKYI